MSINQARGVLAELMRDAAQGFLSSLNTEQVSKCQFSFPESSERERWAYTPGIRGGLPFTEMSTEQERLARRLLATGLSENAFVAATNIMALEVTLDQLEGWRGRFIRDPRLYYVSIFGTPGGNWAWRFDGHHVSVSYLILNEAVVSATPSFLGSNPADASTGTSHKLRPLGAEEDLGRDLVLSMSENQRELAVVSDLAPTDIVQSNRPQVEDGALPWSDASTPVDDTYGERAVRENEPEILRYRSAIPIGICISDMDDRLKDQFLKLVRHYIWRLPANLAQLEYEKYETSLLSKAYFSWAGSTERYQGHYYRIQGPDLLIEYDNTQNDANHIHSVWRNPAGDFGRDVLLEHYDKEH